MIVKMYEKAQDYNYQTKTLCMPKGLALKGEKVLVAYKGLEGFYVQGYITLNTIVETTATSEKWSVKASRPFIKAYDVPAQCFMDTHITGPFYDGEAPSLQPVLQQIMHQQLQLETNVALFILTETAPFQMLDAEQFDDEQLFFSLYLQHKDRDEMFLQQFIDWENDMIERPTFLTRHGLNLPEKEREVLYEEQQSLFEQITPEELPTMDHLTFQSTWNLDYSMTPSETEPILQTNVQMRYALASAMIQLHSEREVNTSRIYSEMRHFRKNWLALGERRSEEKFKRVLNRLLNEFAQKGHIAHAETNRFTLTINPSLYSYKQSLALELSEYFDFEFREGFTPQQLNEDNLTYVDYNLFPKSLLLSYAEISDIAKVAFDALN